MPKAATKKPTLHLLKPNEATVADVIKLWEQLTGKKATAEQWAKVKAELKKP